MNESVKGRIIKQFQNLILLDGRSVAFYKDYDRNNVLIEKGSTGYIRNLKELCGTVNLLKFDFFDARELETKTKVGHLFDDGREVKLFLFEANLSCI